MGIGKDKVENKKENLLFFMGTMGTLLVHVILQLFCQQLIIGNNLILAFVGALTFRIIPTIILAWIISHFCKNKISSKLPRIVISAVISFVITGICPFFHNDLAQSKVYGSPLVYSVKLIEDITTKDTTTVEVNSPTRHRRRYSYSTGRRVAQEEYCCIDFNGLSVIITADVYNELYALSDELDFEDYRAIFEEYKYKLYSDLKIKKELGLQEETDYFFSRFCFQYVSPAQDLPYKCTIEYYNGSKKIKAINGYNFDTELEKINSDVFSMRLNNIIPLFDEAISDYEKQEKKSAVIEIIKDKEGTDIGTLRAEMTKNGFIEDMDYKIITINSKMYSVGTIVDLDYIQEEIPTLYVVEGDSSEDLVEFPDLGGLTKDEAISVLIEAGFDSYIVDEALEVNNAEYVYTVGEGKGTFVPKQKKIWFSCTSEK